jgi:cytochrome c oxidase subunit 1
MFGTGLAGARRPQDKIEFAEPLQPPGRKGLILDNMKLWTALAIVLVIAAYAIPIIQHLSMERFGARGLSPF